jgi:hypothetical protein
MDPLERDLTALAAAIEWPAPPDTVLTLPSVAATPHRVRRPRPLVLAAALLAAGLAAAFAVPQSRGAILRFLHLGGVTIELVDRLPQAQERPLAAGLGPTVSEEAARAGLRGSLLLPQLSPLPPLHRLDAVVSLVFLERGSPVLLSELYASGGYVLKKLAAGATRVESVRVGSDDGLWLSGAPHLFLAPEAPPRLAGNVLVWQHGDVTLRLEGRDLTLRRAQELARALR